MTARRLSFFFKSQSLSYSFQQSSSAILLLQARAKYCLWEVRFTVQIRTKTGFFTWHMSEYQLSKVIGLWLWEPNILPACTTYSSTEEHYLSCKKLCKKLLMAGLVLELIKFLPALSADSSTHRNVQRSSVMERGSEPWCRARWGSCCEGKSSHSAGGQTWFTLWDSFIHWWKSKENTLLILGVFTEHHTQGVKFSL